MQVTVDAAELRAGLDHSGGAPAQRQLPVAPAFLTLAACSRQTEIIDSIALVERSVFTGPLASIAARILGGRVRKTFEATTAHWGRLAERRASH